MTIFKKTPTYKHTGFSFIEMLMILTLLTVVSMPLLISMNAQNRELQKSDTQTTGNIAIDKLFDVVDPNIPLAARANFVIGKQINGTQVTYKTTTSVFCDPLSPSQDSDKCDEGPFFFRRYIGDPRDNKLTVEIGVSDKQNISDNEANISIFKRRYEINAYRLIPKTDTASDVSSDELGDMWYKEAVTTASNAPMAFTEKDSACSGTTTVTNASSITNKYVTHITSTCTPKYHFKVAPGENYDLTMYFTNLSNPGVCLANTNERSKHLVNIRVTDTHMVPQILTERRNIDIGTKVRNAVGGKAQEQFFFHVPPGEADIIVEPTVPSLSCTGAFADVSAIELNRL